METRGLSKLGVQVGSDAAPPTLDKSFEPAVAVHGVNRLMVLPIGDDGQSVRALDVGAIDEIAGPVSRGSYLTNPYSRPCTQLPQRDDSA
jgi:hypothetical protein